MSQEWNLNFKNEYGICKGKKNFPCASSAKTRRYQFLFRVDGLARQKQPAPTRIKLQYLVASEMSLSAYISPFRVPSIKKGGGNYSRREEAKAAPRLVLALEESRAGKHQHMTCAQLVASIHAQKNTGHGDILSLFIHGNLSKPAFLYRSQNKNWTMHCGFSK